MNMTRLKRHLKTAEGWSPVPYTDTVGIWTIGYGHALIKEPPSGLRWTKGQSETQLLRDVADAIHDASSFAWFPTLDAVRQEVIVELAFNMGLPRLQGFRKMIAALAVKDYDRAADELQDSRWYGQVGVRRGRRLVEALRTGIWPVVARRG
jgi:lysozyme